MRLIGYTRVSRLAGREGPSFISIVDQRKCIEAMATAHGHTVVDWEQDLDQSGSRWARPGFQAALEAVEQGAADGICVARLDRFARSVADSAKAIERLEAVGGSLVAVDLGMDTSTHGGRLMRNVLMALAEFELERAREGFATAGSYAAARGVHVCNTAPVGYSKGEGGRLELDPIAAPVVREVFRRRAAGATWSDLCAFLDEKLPRETNWTRGTVTGLIARRTYLGEARGGGTVNEDAHEPLVTRAEFEAAQAARSDGRYSRGADGGALLAGIARCGGCGHILTRAGGGSRGYSNYKCRKRHSDGVCAAPAGISCARADKFIEAEFLAAVEPLQAAGKASGGAFAAALAALEVAERDLDDYRDADVIAAIGKEVYVAGLVKRQQAVDDAGSKLQAASAVSPLDGMRDLHALWPKMDVSERRHLLGSVLERVVVSPAPRGGQGTAPADRLELVWR